MSIPLELNNINNFVKQLVKKCIPFLSANDSGLAQKFNNMNLLYTIWKKDTDEVYSVEVYASVAEMFASNVFRPLPPSSYVSMSPAMPVLVDYDDNVEAVETEANFTQTTFAFKAFQAFVDRNRFDADRASTLLDRRFINSLVHRLNSGDAHERLTSCDTMARTWYACPAIREHILDAVTAELADFAYGYVSQHNGLDDLLDFLADNIVYESVRQESIDKLFRVLMHLLKHPFLIVFKNKLIDCVRVLDYNKNELIPQMLLLIVKLWSFQNLKTIALLRTMIELYNVCDKNEWVPLQLRIIGPLSKLFTNDDFLLAEESMNFWKLILHENIKFWQNNQSDIRMVVSALKKVKRTHWNSESVKLANSLLNIMSVKNLIKDSYVEDSKEMFHEGIARVNYEYPSIHIQKLMSLKLSSTLPSSTDMPTTNI